MGLYYLRARYYNPFTGRFVSVDSEAGEGQRRYEYAAADPVDGMDPSGNEAIIEFALLQFYPGRLPFNLGFRISWCGFAGSGYLLGCGGGAGGSGGPGAGPGGPGGPPFPPCTGPNCKRGKLGIGIEVPKSSAIVNHRLDPLEDPGHTFVYLKDESNTVVSILSFGPVSNVMWSPVLFNEGKLHGTGRYHLDKANASTWETYVSVQELHAGEQDISNFKAAPPNYTKSFNCTSAAVSMAAQIGVNLPDGVGPVLGAGNVANPYTLNQQMTTAYGPGQVVNMGDFPKP